MLRSASEYNILAIDSCYTKGDIDKIHVEGCGTVLCYVNYGMAEKDWENFASFKTFVLGSNDDWDEYWVDVTASEWKNHIRKEVLAAKKKGFDGIWLDNGDIYWYVIEHKKDKTLGKKIYAAMIEMCQWIKGQKMKLILNGADTFVSKLMDENKQKIIDGVNQETVFSRIKSYRGDGKFGEQTIEDQKYFSEYCVRCKGKGLLVFLLEYTNDAELIAKIDKFCTSNNMDGYYVSPSIKL